MYNKLTNDELEYNLLATLINHQDQLAIVKGIIEPEAFYSWKNREIYEVMLSLQDRNLEIGMPTVMAELPGRKDEIRALATEFAPGIYAETMAIQLTDLHNRRKILDMAQFATAEVMKEGEEYSTIISKISRLLHSIGGHVNLQPIADAASKTVERISKIMAGEITPAIPTFIPELDEIIGGYHPTDLIIIAARPAMGKTSLACSLLYLLGLAGYPASMYSLEMGSEQLANKLISFQSGVPANRLRNAGDITKEEFERIKVGQETIAKMPIMVDDFSTGNATAIISSISKSMLSPNPPAVVIVDYLQLMTGGSRSDDNRNNELSGITRAFKQLARQYGITIILLSQLNRKLEERTDKRPRLSDLRDSGAIEQDADIVMSVYRPEVYDENEVPNLAELILLKHRHGPTGTVITHFDKTTTKFSPGIVVRENIND